MKQAKSGQKLMVIVAVVAALFVFMLLAVARILSPSNSGVENTVAQPGAAPAAPAPEGAS